MVGCYLDLHALHYHTDAYLQRSHLVGCFSLVPPTWCLDIHLLTPYFSLDGFTPAPTHYTPLRCTLVVTRRYPPPPLRTPHTSPTGRTCVQHYPQTTLITTTRYTFQRWTLPRTTHCARTDVSTHTRTAPRGCWFHLLPYTASTLRAARPHLHRTLPPSVGWTHLPTHTTTTAAFLLVGYRWLHDYTFARSRACGPERLLQHTCTAGICYYPFLLHLRMDRSLHLPFPVTGATTDIHTLRLPRVLPTFTLYRLIPAGFAGYHCYLPCTATTDGFTTYLLGLIPARTTGGRATRLHTCLHTTPYPRTPHLLHLPYRDIYPVAPPPLHLHTPSWLHLGHLPLPRRSTGCYRYRCLPTTPYYTTTARSTTHCHAFPHARLRIPVFRTLRFLRTPVYYLPPHGYTTRYTYCTVHTAHLPHHHATTLRTRLHAPPRTARTTTPFTACTATTPATCTDATHRTTDG